MMNDDYAATLREAVAAFRALADDLMNPIPGLTAGVLALDIPGDLSPDLSLLEFAPLNALPQDTGLTVGGEAGAARRSSAPIPPLPEAKRGAAAPAIASSQPPPASVASSPTPPAPAGLPPVFSLRRGKAANAQAGAGAEDVGKPGASPEIPAKAGERSSAPQMSRRAAAREETSPYDAPQVVALNSLAEDVLNAAGETIAPSANVAEWAVESITPTAAAGRPAASADAARAPGGTQAEAGNAMVIIEELTRVLFVPAAPEIAEATALSALNTSLMLRDKRMDELAPVDAGDRPHDAIAPVPPVVEILPRADAPVDTPSAALPDAVTLAALVNEVLVEQARRYGVDLS